MTAKRPDSKPIRASGLIRRGDTVHRFKTKFAASVSFQTACAGLLLHSRTGGNPNTNTPFTPPTAEFVIPAQAGIQASDFQKRLENLSHSQTPSSATGLRQLMAIRSILIRWIIFSDGLRNHRGTITNTRTINTVLTTCRHLPAPVCFVIPMQAEIQTRTRRSYRPRQNSSFPRRRESRHRIFRNA